MSIPAKLGIVLVVALNAVAIIAPGAQGHEFQSSTSPTVITGEFYSGINDIFTFEGSSGTVAVECATAKFEGTQGVSSAKTLTITPTYGSTSSPTGCTAAGAAATVHAQHCAYVFSGTTNASEEAQVEIECSGASESQLLVTVPSFGITLHIQAQTPGGGVHYTNFVRNGHREVTITSTLKELKTTCTGVGCFFLGTTTKTKLEGIDALKGYKDVSCSEGSGTSKTTPSLAACEGEQIDFSVNPG
jgi:hypothetical protein